MKIKIIEMNGNETVVECKSFEFRTNQVSNWIRITYENSQQEMFRRIATIKSYEDK